MSGDRDPDAAADGNAVTHDGPDVTGEKIDRAVVETLERMAHQLKNPLQAVAMNLEVIRMRVQAEAPEVWEQLDRFARAVDENVRLLDRRVRLLLALGRRSPEDPAEGVDVEELVRDFVAALQLDRDAPAVRIEAEGPDRAARARAGYVLELLLETTLAARRAAPDRDALPVRVARGGESVRLELPLPEEAADGLWREHGDRWRRLGARSGGRLAGPPEEGEGTLVLTLPFD